MGVRDGGRSGLRKWCSRSPTGCSRGQCRGSGTEVRRMCWLCRGLSRCRCTLTLPTGRSGVSGRACGSLILCGSDGSGREVSGHLRHISARSCDLDHVLAVHVVETFDAIPWWQECVEPLNKGWMTFEQIGHAINDARCVDAESQSMGHATECSE